MVLTIGFLVYEIQHIIQILVYEQLVRLRQPAQLLQLANPSATRAVALIVPLPLKIPNPVNRLIDAAGRIARSTHWH